MATDEPAPSGPVGPRHPTPRFTPDPFGDADFADIPESLHTHMRLGRELAERSLAVATLDSYGRAWQRWATWCDAHGFDPTDYNPTHLELWIIELTAEPDDHEIAAGRLRPVSLGPGLAAIDRAAKAIGQAPPSHDPRIQDLMAGVRRSFGMAPTQQRTALEADLLCDLVAHLSAPTDLRSRKAVVVAFRGAGLSLAECSGRETNGVGWEHITFDIDSAMIDVPSQRGNRRRSVVLTGGDLASLRHLHELDGRPDSGPVINLTRQGVSGAARRAITDTGLPTNADVTDPAIRSRVYAALAEPTNAQLRDLALLTVGWFSALRRSNLDLLRWSDITTVKGGIELYIRRSKNDQEGHGATIYIPAAGDSGLPCPVTALERYRDRLRSETGVDLLGSEEPVFVSVDRHDHFGRVADDSDGPELDGMSGGAIHAAIRRIVERAGIDPSSYGSHSLRAGFITSAFAAGVSAADIAHTSLHKSLDVLMVYNRPTDRRRRSAAAQMHRATKNDRETTGPPTDSHRPPDGPPAAFMP